VPSPPRSAPPSAPDENRATAEPSTAPSNLRVATEISIPPVESRADTINSPIEAGIRPSGSFCTPALNAQAAKHTPGDGVTNPLIDHQTAPRAQKKFKCIRTTVKEVTVSFGDPTNFEETMTLARTILVVHVRGRTFTTERLKLWVKEIWGAQFSELPEVQELPRGWFSLHFSKEDHMNIVLAQYWHIEMAPVLLKRWSPLFDPEREQIGAGPL